MAKTNWKEYIGDSILTVAVNGQFILYLPKSCTELTERIIKQMPMMLHFNGIEMCFTDGETEIDDETFKKFNSLTADDFLNRSPYSFDILEDSLKWVRVEYETLPQIETGKEFKIKLYIHNKSVQIHHSQLKLIMPEGFTALPYQKSVHLEPCLWDEKEGSIWEATIIPGENIESVNRCYVEITTSGHCSSMMVPLTLLG